jgi:hypothetical protein
MFSGAGTTCRSPEVAAQAGHHQPAPAWRAYRPADASCSPPTGQLGYWTSIYLHFTSIRKLELHAGTPYNADQSARN